MSEIDDLRKHLGEGFRAAMILREPTDDELRKLPEAYFGVAVRALPLMHPDGRKLMYYLKDPAAIEFAEALVEDQKTIISYDQCVYCSGVGPDTIHGRTLYLEEVVPNLQQLLAWDVKKSEFPHTLEVSFKIAGDDRTAVEANLTQVRKAALALSLRNRIGFAVGSSSSGVRYKGQPFSLKLGLQERLVRGLEHPHLTHVDRIWDEEKAFTAASALQTIYSQVTDDARITAGWAAIEHIFGSPPQHLLAPDELSAVLDAVENLHCISADKRRQLQDKLRNPDLIAKEGRNVRIARSISQLLGTAYDKVYDQVRSLTRERARRVHKLSDQVSSLADHGAFVEGVLWAFIEAQIPGPNPFTERNGAG